MLAVLVPSDIDTGRLKRLYEMLDADIYVLYLFIESVPHSENCDRSYHRPPHHLLPTA